MIIKDITYYKRAFSRLRCRSYGKNKAPHKLILLLSVIDRVEQLVSMGTAGLRMIDRCLIDLNPRLERFFYYNWQRYVNSDKFHPVFYVPFYHMDSEPFWQLVKKKDVVLDDVNITDSTLKANFEGAIIDRELMQLLVDAAKREELRTILLDRLFNHQEENAIFHEENQAENFAAPIISFWDDFVQFEKKTNGKFAEVKPTSLSYLMLTLGKFNVKLVIMATYSYIELYIKGNSFSNTRKQYYFLLDNRKTIEKTLGGLKWDFNDQQCTISIKKQTKISFLHPQSRSALINFFSLEAHDFCNVFSDYLLENTERKLQAKKHHIQKIDVSSFEMYMRRQGLSENTINKYAHQSPNNTEVLHLIYSLTGKDSLYDITNPKEAEELRNIIRKCYIDEIGHHMYSSAISKYIEFLKNPTIVEEANVILTRELIEAARTPNGGFTKSQLAAIGIAWPPPQDWIEQKIGERITKTQLDQFKTIKYVACNKISNRKK